MNPATMADVMDVDIKEAADPPAQPLTVQAPTRSAVALTTPGELLRLAMQNGANIEMLERLLDLQQRFEEREAEKAMVQAMSAFKREPIEIYKRKGVGYHTKEGDFIGYKHAQLSDVTDAITPAMARHGLSFGWDVEQNGNQITVHCIVTHERGCSKKVTMVGAPDTSGKKNAIQQVASTVTYLQRYTLLAVTGMSTKDEDDDGAGGADQPGDAQQREPEANRTRESRAAKTATQAEKVFYDQKKFDTNKAQWRDLIVSGEKTVAQIIKVVESKGAPLTEDQKLTLDSYSHEKD